MSGKVKSSLCVMVLLGGPIFIILGLGAYMQNRNAKFRLVLKSARFLRTTESPVSKALFHIVIYVGHTGDKPQWWGEKGKWLRFKDVQLKASDGSTMKLVPVKPNLSSLHMQQGGHYIAKENAYYQFLTTRLPSESVIDGGNMEATVQIVDSPIPPYEKIYAEGKIYSSVHFE